MSRFSDSAIFRAIGEMRTVSLLFFDEATFAGGSSKEIVAATSF